LQTGEVLRRIEVGGTILSGGIYGIAENGSVQAQDIIDLNMTGWISGTLTATNSLDHFELGGVVMQGATVSAANMTNTTIHGVMPGGLVTGAYINHFYPGLLYGTVNATMELSDSTIAYINPTGHVEAPTIRDVTVTAFAGELVASSSMEGTVQVSEVGTDAAIHVGTLNGSLQVSEAGTDATIDVGTLNGSLGFLGNMYGSVDVTNDLAGSIWICPTVRYGPDGNLFGAIVVGGNVTGSINVQGNTEQTGSIYVGGTVNDSGLVDIGRDLLGSVTVGSQQQTHNLTGTIHIAGNVSGPGIEIWGNLGSSSHPGQIKIDGSFGNGSALSWIYAHGNMANAGSFVTVDYDGFHPSHRWAINGRVRIGNAVYSHNTPSMHLYETTLCKGDMNNSGMTLFNDMAPFKLALTDPAGYAAAYPGLAGAMLYHGDLDCDGDIDLDDSNLLSSFIGHCTSTCGGGARLAAQTLAQGILVTVPDEDLADVADLVAQTEDSRYDPQDQEYWHEVSAELGQ
jgi:hypothetical protein